MIIIKNTFFASDLTVCSIDIKCFIECMSEYRIVAVQMHIYMI